MSKTIYPSADLYTMNRSILAVGAHADDLEIHAGGTLAKYQARGYEIIYVMSTNNMSGDISQLQPDGTVRHAPPETCVPMMARRKREAAAAAAALGTTPIHLDHPQRHYKGVTGEEVELRYGCELPEGIPANIPSILTAGEDPASIQRLADLILERDPECVLSHGVSQVNIEHFATALLVTRAYWKAVDAGYKGAMLQWREAHHLYGEQHMQWDTFVDYTPLLGRKMELIGLHASQMPKAHRADFGHRLLSQWWGAACGCGAAEVFTWVNRPRHRDSVGPIYGELMLELIQNSK